MEGQVMSSESFTPWNLTTRGPMKIGGWERLSQMDASCFKGLTFRVVSSIQNSVPVLAQKLRANKIFKIDNL